MKMSEIAQKIEELSIKIVILDADDLQEIGDLYRIFDEISELAGGESQDPIASAAKSAAELIEDIIMDQVSDKEAAIDVITRAISAMQAVAVNNRPYDEVSFPEELGMQGVDESTSDENESKDSDGEDVVQDEEDYFTLSDPELAADFVSESREHLHDTDVQLLTLESEPGNDDALNAVYRAFHTIKGIAGFLGLEQISELAHATEDLLDRARKGDICLTGSAIDVTFESVDALKQMVDDVEAGLSSGKVVSRGEILSKLLPAIEASSSDDEAPDDSNMPDNDEIEEMESPQPVEEISEQKEEIPTPVQQQSSGSAASRVRETLKIDTERLDRLVNTIGELVIAESMVSQDAEILADASPRVSRNLSHLNKITRELQEIGMSLRLMPVRPVFERMARLVRDLSRKSGKKISFTTSGEDTEVDKSIVEKISDPLTHMLRNAVDHGIESSDDRIKWGKPEEGNIELRAFHKGSNIHIEVEDDGRGLDKENILAKAAEYGIITDGDSMSEKEIFNLIFNPGFSTAKQVTDVSGRGVGMDVVNRNLQALRGKMEIESTLGEGSKFSMRLPLTLAIIDGIVVRVGKKRYIIPTLSVLESLRPGREDVSTMLNEGEMISVRGQLIPLFRIASLFGIGEAEQDPTQALIVIVEDGENRTGLMVDDLIGHQQVVIKSLGGSLGNVTGISGGAIMADGRVGLILDVAGIIKMTTGVEDLLAV